MRQPTWDVMASLILASFQKQTGPDQRQTTASLDKPGKQGSLFRTTLCYKKMYFFQGCIRL